MEQKDIQKECGTVLLEGAFSVVVTILFLSFFLSFGFYIYQRTIIHIVANEIAEEIVVTYKFRDVDDCEDIALDKITNIGRYRNILHSSLFDTANEQKATSLANTRLSKTSLGKADGSAQVNIEKIGDDLGRVHYEVTVSQKYEFLLGDLLSLVGLSGVDTISSTVYVEAIDVSNYINTVKMTNYGLKKFTGAIPLLDTINSVINLMQSVYKIFT